MLKNEAIILFESDKTEFKPNPKFSLALSALGAILWQIF